MPDTFWHVDDSLARLSLSRFSARLEPGHSERGLFDVDADGSRLKGIEVLGVDLAPRATALSTPADTYVRVGDLVATYADIPQPAMRTEVYWRAGIHGGLPAIGGVELMVSVQTSLLDSHPQLATRSHLCADEVLTLLDASRQEFESLSRVQKGPIHLAPADGPRCLLFRLPGGAVSYAEMVHPADAGNSEIRVTAAEVDAVPSFDLRHQLFAAELEKGVILRARIRGVVIDRQDDLTVAAQHYDAFVAEAPPLTR